MIKADNDRWLTAEGGGGVNADPNRGPAGIALVADRTDADITQYGNGWQSFEVIHNDDQTVSLRLGQWYVTAEGGGGGSVSTDRTENGPWQRFTMETIAGSAQFLCSDGVHFLKVRMDLQRPVVDATGTLSGMRFRIEGSVPGNLSAPPTRDEIIDVGITFQGLVYNTKQFGRLPSFEACLPWLTPEDRQVVYAAKKASTRGGRTPNGDTHALLTIPDGPPLYDESNQAYSADRFPALDWTAGNSTIESKTTDLIREVIGNGFNRILLYLGGDGDGDHYKIAFKQLELLAANEDYRTTLYKYCIVIPGWDGVFYGWPLEQIMNFGIRFRQLFSDGHLGLHYSTGHIPVGEGGDDYKPRPAGQDPQKNPGRMADYDVLIGEYDNNLHQDSTWQILNRLEEDYRRPSDQPGVDDPNRVYYLSTPNPRGRWGHCAMEYGEYEAVRCGEDFDGMVKHVNENREYMYSMNVRFPG
jgi:hypothetical protein